MAVNTRYRAVEVADIVGRSGAKVLACAPGFRGIDFLSILAGIASHRGALLPLHRCALLRPCRRWPTRTWPAATSKT